MERRVMSRRVRLDSTLVMPVAAACARFDGVARSKPLLSEVSKAQVVRCIRATHLGRYPTWSDRVTENIGPAPCDGCCKRRDKELAIRIGARGSTTTPIHPFEARPPAAVHPAAQVNQASRSVNERSEYVGRDDVDWEHPRAGVNPRVMDHRIHTTQLVNLSRDTARLIQVGEISDDRYGSLRQQLLYSGQPFQSTHMYDYLMAFGEERSRRCQP